MALQGDLKSFALPDVLRLLAGTSKSGHLEVLGASGTGSVVLRKGLISSATASAAPRAIEIADALYELLRLGSGSFSFEEGDVADKGFQADVDVAITQAESLVAEWLEIEAVIPSMGAWLSLAPEVADEVIISVPTWQALVAIGGGGNVHDLAAALDLSDLAASRRVLELVAAQLVDVRPTHGYQPPTVELDDFEPFEEPSDPISDFEDLVAEDRPVVMEDREDALLPEPLPGEGVAYEGETITGFVDGRTTFDLAPVDQPVETFETFEAFESLASFEEAAAMSEFAGEPGTIDGFGDADPFVDSTHGEPDAETSLDGDHQEHVADAPEVMEMVAADPVPEGVVDGERDSLLKFLSSVKP